MKKGKLTAAVSGVALLAGTIGLSVAGGATAQAAPQLITDQTLLHCVDDSISANFNLVALPIFGQILDIQIPGFVVQYPEQPGSSSSLALATDISIPAWNAPMLNLQTIFSPTFWENMGTSTQTPQGTSPSGNLLGGFWSSLTPYCNNTPGTGIQNLNGLGDAGFSNLLGVNFNNNNISDISGLSNVVWNNWAINNVFNFFGTGGYFGLTPKAGDGSLLEVFLDGNPRLSDLSPLVTQKNIIDLSVNGDQVYDLSTIGGNWFNLLGSWGLPIQRFINAQGEMIPFDSSNAAMNAVAGQETPILPILPNGFPVSGPQLSITPASNANVSFIPGTNVPTAIPQDTATSGTVNADGTITFATPGWYNVKWNAPASFWGNVPLISGNSTFSGQYWVYASAATAPTVTVTATATETASTCTNGQNVVTGTNLQLTEGKSLPNNASDGSVTVTVVNGQLQLVAGSTTKVLGNTGNYYWAFQADGNVVQYNAATGAAAFVSNTRVGSAVGNYVAVQCNGDVVVYPGTSSQGVVLLSANH